MTLSVRSALTGLLLLCLGVCALPAADPASPARRPITPADLWAFARLGSPEVSADGRLAVFTVQRWDVAENSSQSHLWLVDVTTGATRQLTRAKASDSSPRFSPDGRRLAFTSKRPGDEQPALYVLPVDGGEAERVLELPLGVSQPRWLPDGRIVVLTRVLPGFETDRAALAREVKRRQQSKVTARVTEDRTYRFWDTWRHEGHLHRLLVVDPATGATTDLTPKWDRLFNLGNEFDYAVSPDGKHLVASLNSTPAPYREEPNADVYLIPTDGSGELRNLTPDNRHSDTSPTFSPDGGTIYFTRQVEEIGAGELRRLWRHDRASGRNTPVAPQLDLSIEQWEVSGDGRTLFFIAEDRGVVPVFRLDLGRGEATPLFRDGSAGSLRRAGDRLLFLHETMSRPAELALLDPATGERRLLTDFNGPLLAQLDLGAVESLTFRGAGGATVQLWLILPPGFDPAQTYPLLQLMHGGPHTMVRDAFSYRWNSHVFAAAGHVVAWVNRHGSTGFGEAFARSIIGQWGPKPMDDVLAATDFLLQRHRNLDPKRVGAAGASYGGYLATWILGHTDRFAVLVNHAGVSNLNHLFAGDVTYGWTETFGGTPWKGDEAFQANNPMNFAPRFRTPTLVIHGELDYRVPVGQGLELYGVLQAMGVPSRLVYYPNENHWILSPQNSIHWNTEVRNWLVRYLGGTPLELPPFPAKDVTS